MGRDDTGREPGVHDLVDAPEAVVGGGDRGGHRGFGPELALERERGDAELLEPVDQAVGEGAGAGDDDAAGGDGAHVQTSSSL